MKILRGASAPLFVGKYSNFDLSVSALIGAGNNPMVGMTVAVAVAIEEASK